MVLVHLGRPCHAGDRLLFVRAEHPCAQSLASLFFLLRRTLGISVGTEHAAVPGFRGEYFAALLTLVKVLAGVRGHRLCFFMPTKWTGDGGSSFH